MKLFLKKHVPFVVMMSILLTMIIILIVLGIAQNNIQFAEWWTRTFSRNYTSAFGRFQENLVFSFTEVSFIVSIVSCVVFLAWAFCCLRLKQIWKFLHRLMMVLLVVVGAITIYSASVGVAYHRRELPLEGYKGEIKKEEFKDIASYFVNDYNECANALERDENNEIIMPYSKDTLIYKLRDEFQRLPKDGYFGKYVPRAKPMLSSAIYTAFGIVGVYFGPLGESHYSTFATNAELPFYITHELAHGVGVMREDDAQLVATYLGLTSDDPYIRYSCYFNTIDSIIDICKLSGNPDDYNQVRGMLSQKIWDNYSYIYYHWKGKTFISDLGDKINDLYLKMFGQKEGTSSYDDTKPDVTPSGQVIKLSHYQSYYFKKYYDAKNQ